MTDKLTRRRKAYGGQAPRRRRAKAPKTTEQTPPLSKADQAALAAFCESIKVEEISQASWESCMSEMDVKVPLHLDADDVLAGGEWEIRCSREVRGGIDEKPMREPVRITVTVPPQAFDGLELRHEKLGDKCGERRGDLVIIVRIKCGS